MRGRSTSACRAAPSRAPSCASDRSGRPVTLSRVDEGTALVGLLVNLPLPGVGSLIAGKTREGVLQLVMVGVSLPLCFLLVGFPMLFGAWIWALVTGIRGRQRGEGAIVLVSCGVVRGLQSPTGNSA